MAIITHKRTRFVMVTTTKINDTSKNPTWNKVTYNDHETNISDNDDTHIKYWKLSNL